MIIKDIQEEHKEWSNVNFPNNNNSTLMLLGIIEELGELSHAHLKNLQNIRTNENHQANKIDAIGDIFIFLCSYCTHEGIDLEQAIITTWNNVKLRNWIKDPKRGITITDLQSNDKVVDQVVNMIKAGFENQSKI